MPQSGTYKQVSGNSKRQTVQKQTYITIIVLLASCGQTNSNADKNAIGTTDTTTKTEKIIAANTISLRDTTVKFLWRGNKYDEELKDSFNSIFINEDYCKTISDPERAVLGYVGTFIGNECWWEGEAKDDRSNLKCKILSALNLGYQCSDKHLGFLRQWFKNDKEVLESLTGCPTTPYTSTIQDTFDEITLTIKGNIIVVWYSANSVNVREGESWSWSETEYFQVENDNIQLIKSDKSKVKHEHFKTGE